MSHFQNFFFHGMNFGFSLILSVCVCINKMIKWCWFMMNNMSAACSQLSVQAWSSSHLLLPDKQSEFAFNPRWPTSAAPPSWRIYSNFMADGRLNAGICELCELNINLVHIQKALKVKQTVVLMFGWFDPQAALITCRIHRQYTHLVQWWCYVHYFWWNHMTYTRVFIISLCFISILFYIFIIFLFLCVYPISSTLPSQLLQRNRTTGSNKYLYCLFIVYLCLIRSFSTSLSFAGSPWRELLI